MGFCNHVNGKHKKEMMPEKYWRKFCLPIFKNEKKIRYSTGSCLFCGKPTEFRSIVAGYKNFCSHKCSMEDPENKLEKYKKTKEALFKKYGVENASQIKEVPEKVKKTKLERYGNENFTNKEKIEKTNLRKYGVKYYQQTKEYLEKTKITSLQKYGVEYHAQAKSVKEKTKETNLRKYGVEYVLQVPEIREKIKKTMTDKYGGFPLEHANPLSKKIRSIQKEKFEKRLNKAKLEHINIIDVKQRIFECKICKNQFKQKRVTLNRDAGIYHPRCLGCFPSKDNKSSLFQQEFISFISELGIDFRQNDRLILKEINQELDVYIPEKNIAFELDGLFWHSQGFGNKSRNYHLQKTEKCEEQNIHLIHIFSDEWENQTTLIKEKIKYLLGLQKNLKLIHPRKCEIKIITDHKIKNDFLDKNHIQGRDIASSIRLGAFFDNQLCAVMIFCKPRISLNIKNQKNKNIFELLRFAIDNKIRCPGIASKILKYFIKNFEPKTIFTYADRRWSKSFDSNLYTNLGFQFMGFSQPSHWYLSPETEYKIREYRFKYRKSRLPDIFKEHFDPNLSEWENMQKNRYDRIWDCGTIKYLLEI